VGLGFLSTSYTGNPGKLALEGNFLGCVRNIRVKNPNQILYYQKNTRRPLARDYLAIQRMEKPAFLEYSSESAVFAKESPNDRI
jgi:hypothetical protein